jgi:hypothetical protein
MFKDSNSRMKKLMSGNRKDIDLDIIDAAQREFEGQIKLINATIQAFGIQSKNNRAMGALKRMNILDDSTAIDLMLGNPADDKVNCPEQDKLITRAECLDYSGSHPDCQGCEIGPETKQLLLPPRD